MTQGRLFDVPLVPPREIDLCGTVTPSILKLLLVEHATFEGWNRGKARAELLKMQQVNRYHQMLDRQGNGIH